MIRKGMIVFLARGWQRPAYIRVIGLAPNGKSWMGLEVGKRRGRDGVEPLRTFRPSEIKACRVAEGFRTVLPGVFL